MVVESNKIKNKNDSVLLNTNNTDIILNLKYFDETMNGESSLAWF